jgi:NADH-quinone oxidoreductase subunit L
MPDGLALLAIPALPLVAAAVAYAVPRMGARIAGYLCTAALAVGAALGAMLLAKGGAAFSVAWFTLPDPRLMATSGGRELGLAVPFALDAAWPQMLFIFTTAAIALAVMVFALRERAGDPRARQFYATLTAFAASMLFFIAADTLLVMYFAWELMGVCSYLLIAHRGTPEARRAARQAFWTTRATDFGLLFAVLILLTLFHWPTLTSIDVPGYVQHASAQVSQAAVYAWLGGAALLALLAALGKAAQFPLCFWLPDAMVAPSPVSALLHAAAMVAAGPYLLITLHSLFAASEVALLAAVLVGGVTLVLGGILALCAAEPKRVLAYSTLSQLGLVILAVGALAEEPGLYHLISHAWFKAALFLAVGYVVAAAPMGGLSHAGAGADEHSRTLGELRGAARGPLVRVALILAGLSLAGIWPLAGSLGKEQVLHALLTRHAAEPMPGAVLGVHYPLAAAGWKVGAVLFLLALPVTAAYATRLVGVLVLPVPRPSGALPRPEAAGAGIAARGWGGGLWAALLLAVAGSIGWALAFPSYREELSSAHTAWKWSGLSGSSGWLVLAVTQAFVIVAIVLTWMLSVARPARGEYVVREGGLKPLIAFFGAGMYLREFFHTLVGRTGELLAILAGIAEVGVVDALAMRLGAFGRALAAVARWLDDHVVDGARFRVCELCWDLKRLHSRTMQTGSIQHYMFVILLGAAVMCFLVLPALGAKLAEILGRL